MMAKSTPRFITGLVPLRGEVEIEKREKKTNHPKSDDTHAVAKGDFSPALRVALGDREREIAEITAKVLESRPDSMRVKLRNLRSFVVLHMRDIRSIVNFDTAKTRSLFAKHIDPWPLRCE